MKKLIAVAGIVAVTASAALAGTASASEMVLNPDTQAGQITLAGGGPADFNGSAMGFYNSRVTGNGDYISAQAHELGGRGQAVKATLGHYQQPVTRRANRAPGDAG